MTSRQPAGKAWTKIGLLLPESKTTRHEQFDRPYMEAKLKELCPKCEVLYQNADQDSSKQQSQANDGTAGGAIAAMKGGGFSPIPPTTGQDAELAAIQRILAGDQYMTVYKAIKP